MPDRDGKQITRDPTFLTSFLTILPRSVNARLLEIESKLEVSFPAG